MSIHFLTFIALDLFAACSIQDECVASVTFFHLSSLCISAALIGTTDDKHPSGLCAPPLIVSLPIRAASVCARLRLS
jgi:hypothetical protein